MNGPPLLAHNASRNYHKYRCARALVHGRLPYCRYEASCHSKYHLGSKFWHPPCSEEEEDEPESESESESDGEEEVMSPAEPPPRVRRQPGICTMLPGTGSRCSR